MGGASSHVTSSGAPRPRRPPSSRHPPRERGAQPPRDRFRFRSDVPSPSGPPPPGPPPLLTGPVPAGAAPRSLR